MTIYYYLTEIVTFKSPKILLNYYIQKTVIAFITKICGDVFIILPGMNKKLLYFSTHDDN